MAYVQSAPPAAAFTAIPSTDTVVDGRRLLALIIDLIPLAFLTHSVNTLMSVLHLASLDGRTPAVQYLSVTKAVLDDGLRTVCLMILYFAMQEVLFGRTLGKRLMGLRIVDRQGGSPSWRALVLRNVLRPLDAMPWLTFGGTVVYGLYGVALLSLCRNPRRQRIGDRVAQTLVLRDAPRYTPGRPEAPPFSQLVMVVAFCLAAIMVAMSTARSLRSPLVMDRAHFGFTTPIMDDDEMLAGNYWSVRSETLGTPLPAGDMLSYPLHYTLTDSAFVGQGGATHTRSCTGTIAIYWSGFPDGWRLKSMDPDRHCTSS